MKIVGIGANVLDTLITLPRYPEEDTKLYAKSTRTVGGGPCATGLTAAAKLGAECAFIGVLSDDAGGKMLLTELEKYGVSAEHTDVIPGYSSFCAWIWLGEDKASRTIAVDRGNLPPLTLDERKKRAIEEADILMIDGNELSAAVHACEIAKGAGTKVLYDAGGLYEGREKLLAKTDILIPSEEFAIKHTGKSSPEEAAEALYGMYSPELVVVTCGSRGGVIKDENGLRSYSAFKVEAIDTNGAGDVFHGAFAFAYAKGMDADRCALFGSAVSAIKCTRTGGARKGAPSYKEVEIFLKEHGYEL